MQAEKQKKGYNRIARFYDRLLAIMFDDMSCRREMVRDLGLVPGMSVLIIAGGTGRDLPAVAEAIGPAGTITFVDFSEGMLYQARKAAVRLGLGNVNFVHGDASRLDYPAVYDAAICSFAMSVIPDYREAYERMLRAVVTGGRIGILDVQQMPRRALSRLFHAALRLFFPPFHEDRDTQQLMLNSLIEIRRREYFFGYVYVATGRRRVGD